MMLHTLGLKQGQWEPINGEARHINIVLAAGEIDVRVKKRGSSAYSTQMVGGMALELPVFDSVEIRSDTDQIIKVWVSELPLNYSPDSTREVGSNSLVSSVGYVYSGYPHALLPAQVGRNRITLTPQSDVYIGGANLNTQNGVLLKAGQVFSLATQGAVYALETSGAYQPYFTAIPDVNSAELEYFEDGVQTKVFYYENRARTRAWGAQIAGNSGQFNRVYEYDIKTGEKTGREHLVNGFHEGIYFAGSDKVKLVNQNEITTLDLDSGEMEYFRLADNVTPLTDYIFQWAKQGNYEYIVLNNNQIWRSLADANEWEYYADTPPFFAGHNILDKGFVVDSNGRMVGCNNEQLWFKDVGGEWVQGAYPPEKMGSEHSLAIDNFTNTIYAACYDGIAKSLDGGASWSFDLHLPDYGSNGVRFGAVEVMNGAVIAVGMAAIAFKGAGEAYTVKDFPFKGRHASKACISESGRFYANARSMNYAGGGGSYTLRVSGETVPVGGMPVSIMAEVN